MLALCILAARRTSISYCPVPVNFASCGVLGALSLTAKADVRVPFAVGVKVTEIVQLPPAGTLLPQLLVWAKSPKLSPEMLIFVISKATF